MRTSVTHPLKVASVAAPGGGRIGITFCPGKWQPNAMTGAWARDLCTDLDAISAWGATVLVTLVTQEELGHLRVEGMGREAEARSIRWLHLPIEDVSTPTAEWEDGWPKAAEVIHSALDADSGVLVHCKGGLGRAGTVAARILVERGMKADEAIKAVRAVRPGALETWEQEQYVLALRRRGAHAV